MAKPTDRVKVSVRGMAFTGDVRLGVEVFDALRRLPAEHQTPIVADFLSALKDELLRIKKEMKA
jgi:hypothetical protein